MNLINYPPDSITAKTHGIRGMVLDTVNTIEIFIKQIIAGYYFKIDTEREDFTRTILDDERVSYGALVNLLYKCLQKNETDISKLEELKGKLIQTSNIRNKLIHGTLHFVFDMGEIKSIIVSHNSTEHDFFEKFKEFEKISGQALILLTQYYKPESTNINWDQVK